MTQYQRIYLKLQLAIAETNHEAATTQLIYFRINESLLAVYFYSGLDKNQEAGQVYDDMKQIS